MPIYTYNCPRCHARIERLASIAKRDEQRCDAPPPADPRVSEPTIVVVPRPACGELLVREEIEVPAHTPYSWRP